MRDVWLGKRLGRGDGDTQARGLCASLVRNQASPDLVGGRAHGTELRVRLFDQAGTRRGSCQQHACPKHDHPVSYPFHLAHGSTQANQCVCRISSCEHGPTLSLVEEGQTR